MSAAGLGVGKTGQQVVRGILFLALILGLVLFAGGFGDFLAGAYWWVALPHVALGLFGVGGAGVLLWSQRSLVQAEAPSSRLGTLAILTAAFLTLLLATGVLLLVGAATGGTDSLTRLAHLVLAFLTIGSLVVFGLAAREGRGTS